MQLLIKTITGHENQELIILIGPVFAGKSTVGKLLAEKLGWPFVSLDGLERGYIRSAGYDEAMAAAIREAEGPFAGYSYRRQFFDTAVIQFLAEYRTGVLELGGGHPIVPDPVKQERIHQALAPFARVILLLPFPNRQASIQALRPYQKSEYLNPDLNEILLADDCFQRLAKYTFYTSGKTPAETCREILTTV